jgi:hypothetical protein
MVLSCLRARKGFDQLDHSRIERRHWTAPNAGWGCNYASHDCDLCGSRNNFHLSTLW